MRKEGLFSEEEFKNSLRTPENKSQALAELSTFLNIPFSDLYKNELNNISRSDSLFEKVSEFWIKELSKRIMKIIEENPEQLLEILEEAKKEGYYYHYPIFCIFDPEERKKFERFIKDISDRGVYMFLGNFSEEYVLYFLTEEEERFVNQSYSITTRGIFYSAALDAVLNMRQKEIIPSLVLKLKDNLISGMENRQRREVEDLSGDDEEFEYVGEYFDSIGEPFDYGDEDSVGVPGEDLGDPVDDPEFLGYLKKEFEEKITSEKPSFLHMRRLLEGDWFPEDVDDFVFFQETLLKSIGKLESSEENIKMVIEVLRDNLPKMFENFEGLFVFFNKNPEVSSRELLKMRQEDQYPPHKLFLTALIYRLEFGQMDISEEGLEYLGKRLDLGEFNSDNYFAHRGTGDGKIFIFGQDDKELKSYVDFATVDNDEPKEDTLKVEMLSFTYDVLFVPKSDETAEDREQKMKFVEEFKEKYFKVYLEELAGKVGINLNNFGIREQAWFLWYFESCDKNRQARVVDFLKKYGESGFGVFVLQEMDHQAGEKILAIGEKGDEEEVKKIFADVESIIRLSSITEKEIERMFFKDNPSGVVKKDKITEDILNRSLQVLDEYYNLIEQGEVGQQNLENKLQKNKKDLILFASIFKNAFARGQEIDFSQIKGLDLSIMDSGELSDQDKKQMRDIFKGNRTGVSSEFAEQRLKGEFDPVMSESGHKFYTLKKDGQIISFARFDELENGNLYTGFINTAPDIKGMNIGSAFLETVFQREGRNQAIELKVRTDNPAVKLYERFGFQIEGEPHEDSETKKVYFRMVRPPKAEELREAA